jgi:hypothetical protein
MIDSKKRLNITIGLITTTIFFQYSPIDVFGVKILLSLLVLSLLIPSLLEYRKMKILSEENHHLSSHNHELKMRIDQVTHDNLSLKNRLLI